MSATNEVKGKGDIYCNSADLSSLTFNDVFPVGLENNYCLSWMVCGKTCPRPFSTCRFTHAFLDKVKDPDRKLIMTQVMSNPKVWFNAKTVWEVTHEQREKLGDEHGIHGA